MACVQWCAREHQGYRGSCTREAGAAHTCRGSSRRFHPQRSEVVGAAAAARDAACGDAPLVDPTLRTGQEGSRVGLF